MSKKIYLQENALPAFKSGPYKLDVKHKIHLDHNNTGDTFSLEKELYVAGAQFALPSNSVHSVFPAPNKTVDIEDCALPHIALNSKTLPWIRNLMKDGVDQSLPWMALILLHESETKDFEILSNQPLSTLNGDQGTLKTYQFSEVNSPSHKGDDTFTLLKMKSSLFNAIMPLQSGIKLFAHIREAKDIEAEKKEKENINKWGDKIETKEDVVSYLMSNRMPQPGVNHMLLVSLEDMGDYLPTTRNTTNDDNNEIGLVCLQGWSFHAEASKTGFVELAEGLKDNSITHNKDITITNENLKIALQQGYMPLPHHLRNGDNTVSWYRGPLVSYPQNSEEDFEGLLSDQLERLHVETGMLDESYAAAWQLGQLMAIKDKGFAKRLYEWKENNEKQAILSKIRAKNIDRLKGLIPESKRTTEIENLDFNDEEAILSMVKDMMAPMIANIFTNPTQK